MSRDVRQADKLVATISIANSKSCYRVQLKFKELCLQAEILDHIAAAISSCADTLHDFGFKEKANQARGGIAGVRQFKETVIQEHLGFPGSRFGLSPREGTVNDEEGEDVPELDRLDNTENALQIQDVTSPGVTPTMKPEYLTVQDISTRTGNSVVREDKSGEDPVYRSLDSRVESHTTRRKSASSAFFRFLSSRLKGRNRVQTFEHGTEFANVISPPATTSSTPQPEEESANIAGEGPASPMPATGSKRWLAHALRYPRWANQQKAQ